MLFLNVRENISIITQNEENQKNVTFSKCDEDEDNSEEMKNIKWKFYDRLKTSKNLTNLFLTL